MRLPAGHLYGSPLRTYALPELILTETKYAPRSELPDHSHESAYFCLVLQGAYTEAYGRQSRLCNPTTLIFHPPDETHSDRFHEAGGRCFNVQINSQWLKRVREHAAVLENSTHFHGGPLAGLGIKLYREFYELDEASPLAIEGIVLELIAEASRRFAARSRGQRPGWLRQVREILQGRFTEPLTLTDIAGWVGVHPVHLAREFRKQYRCTVGEYIRQLRVEFACRELSQSAAPLVDIALAAGFAHQSHFSRTFKRLTGMTPAEYRLIARRR